MNPFIIQSHALTSFTIRCLPYTIQVMDAPQEIKSKIDVVDLVSEYLPLKPSGTGSFKALCPFHQEKTPSFYVSRPRQSWHCFGCDQGGDIFTFLEMIEGMEFREALEHLANKAGVELPKFKGKSQDRSKKKRLQEVNELAVKFFQHRLNQAEDAKTAREYLKKRGVDDLTSDLFRLGYAPDSWDELTKVMLKAGVTSQELLAAGLAGKSQKRDSVYDRFRGRLMFPIADVHGNFVGFTARILTDAKEAKYINTPETDIYKKSNVVYGLDKAKGEIRQNDLAVIVEGNMDVIASHQVGVGNVVAASGTALTAEQLNLLKRFTKNLAIAFDEDPAGVQATLRGLDLAREQDFNLKIISLPPDAGKDPDEVIKKDVEIWKKAIHDAKPIMDWIYAMAFRLHSGDRPEGKKEVAKMILEEVERIADPIEQDHWVKKLAGDLAVSETAVREALKKRGSSRKTGKSFTLASRESKSDTKSVQKKKSLEEELLTLMIASMEVLAQAVRHELQPEEFLHDEYRTLYKSLKSAYDAQEFSKQSPQPMGRIIHPPESLTPDAVKTFDRLTLLVEHEYQELNQKELLHEFEQALSSLRRQYKNRLRQELEREMREAERIGDSKKIEDLLRQFEELR